MCFPMGKNGEKSLWKEREMNTFPFLSIYFFSHFSPWAKMGLDPPPHSGSMHVILAIMEDTGW